jgi:NAD(P)-dependent dehydrogenase (short-subunit alcohol dehydrogenase family)
VDGSVILLSSMSATHPSPLMFAYSCAKAATDCLVRFAAIEYGARRIKVNSILPCAVRSDMVKEIFATPGFEEAYASEVPLGRVGEPRDVADAALWLAGPSYVTGLNLQMNGGNHLTRYPKLSEISGDMTGAMSG